MPRKQTASPPSGVTSLLYPLDRFYAEAGRPLPSFGAIRGEEMPKLYRDLLAHRNDMTPTLEAWHGASLHLEVLSRQVKDGVLARQVLLLTDGGNLPVEYGAIEIRLERFPEAARPAILECRKPLGAILRDRRIPHSGRPSYFFRLTGDAYITRVLGLSGAPTLYGRHNTLLDDRGEPLAEIVEILPLLPAK
ncbi:MAG: hypothetical protein M5U26_02235 [Planctomycetota bacterium]|nr:hypothetical protein [Planctomycetota bacterium]